MKTDSVPHVEEQLPPVGVANAFIEAAARASLSQLLAALQTNGSSQNSSLDPLNIIMETLSSAAGAASNS
jgi:hypothetical protein